MRRVTSVGHLTAALAAVGLVSSLGAPPVASITLTYIVVNTLTDESNSADGTCSLREAITAVNTRAPSGSVPGECPPGTPTGLDTGSAIVFGVQGTINLTSALPDIAVDNSIDGGGAITVDGGNADQPFRITDASANVRLGGLTITHGSSPSAVNGGGIANHGSLTVIGSTISANTSTGDGGGIYSDGTLTVIGSTISGNASTGEGGGIRSDGSLMVETSTISGNTSTGEGGGIRSDGSLTVENSTISGNTSTGHGGAIRTSGNTDLANLIVAGNAPDDLFGTPVTTTATIVGVPSGKTLADIFVVDPGGDPILADYGGPTRTIALALVAGNPAIDAADSVRCSPPPHIERDQRGKPRAIPGCDIGAYEAQDPNLAAHEDVNTTATSSAGAIVTYTAPAATDEQGGAVPADCTPAPGSIFPVGPTTVTCTASDAVGHTQQGFFSVVVAAFAASTSPSLSTSLVDGGAALTPPPTDQGSRLSTDGTAALTGVVVLLSTVALGALLGAPKRRRKRR